MSALNLFLYLVRFSTNFLSVHSLAVNLLVHILTPLTVISLLSTQTSTVSWIFLTLSLSLGVHHLPLPEPHVVHGGAAVPGGEDEPLVDDGTTTDPLDVSTFLLSQEAEEGELSNGGILPSQDEGGFATLHSALLSLQ